MKGGWDGVGFCVSCGFGRIADRGRLHCIEKGGCVLNFSGLARAVPIELLAQNVHNVLQGGAGRLVVKKGKARPARKHVDRSARVLTRSVAHLTFEVRVALNQATAV